jgi:hypothetical protein
MTTYTIPPKFGVIETVELRFIDGFRAGLADFANKTINQFVWGCKGLYADGYRAAHQEETRRKVR